MFFNSENDTYSRTYGCYQEELEEGHMINAHSYQYNLVQYSKDGVTWTDIPRNGVAVPKLGSLYIRMKIYEPENTGDTEIVFAGPDSNFAYSKAESFNGCCRYDVPGSNLSDMEIDFIATRGEEKVYIQVSDELTNTETRERELASLQAIRDSFEKIILTMDYIHIGTTEDGIKIIHPIDWLLQN